ncbi:MAG: cysteine--tRNA ligase [Simkaniaceae bacterium]|nr:cysteine--tRNA ligase [Candidatus Sacchlamyda saccharinae]
MKLYNTETREKENVIPLEDTKISMYTCGPTVYNFAHIGNFRTYVFEDLLRRTLKYFGYKVTQVMNLTDIDDKTLAGAIHEGKLLKEYTKPYEDAFFEDLKALNVEEAEHYPAATDYIPQMIEIIQELKEKGIAYEGGDGSVYFSITKFPNYGRLSHLNQEDLKAGASERVGTDEYDKENVADFVLWKAYDPKRDGQIFWESPFGRGRPGWHIECSAMAMSILGETIDIHVGGVDNMFPHHENEIAQSEGCTGKTFVKHWLHSEHLLVDHKKMSKSLGNFYTLRDLFEKGYTGPEVRYLLLTAHYRMQLNFTMEGLDAARSSLQRLGDFVERLKTIEGVDDGSIGPILAETKTSFEAALSDDLNISPALAALFEMVRKVNSLCDDNRLGKAGADKTLAFLKEVDAVLGFIPFEAEELDVPLELLDALRKREEARKEKNWAEADKQRDLITSSGYLIEDTPQGPKLKKQ